MRKTILAAGTCVLALTGGANAQGHDTKGESTTLPRIVVTPNRTATEQGKVGAKVEQITEADIEGKSRPLLIDYLNLIPGISISPAGGPGASTNLSVRGLPAKYVKTLYNGIDISDAASTQVQAPYQYLLTGGVHKVEVLKGAQSTLYGSNAIAGLIDISTLDAVDPGVHHILEAEGGSFSTIRGRYAFQAANDVSRLAVNVTGFDTEGISAAAGFPERDGYRNTTFDTSIEHRFSETFSLFGSALYIDTRADFDDPTPADQLDARNLNKMMGARFGLNLDLLDGRLKNTMSVQGFRIDRDILPDEENYVGTRQKLDYQGSFEAAQRLLLQYGVDHERQEAETKTLDWNSFPPTGYLSFKESYDLTGLWTQAVVEPLDDLVLTVGMRHDEHSEFGGYTTYRGTASYVLVDTGMRLHSSIGTGFRAPSLYELYDPVYGSSNLKPETSVSFDAGIEQQFLDDRLTTDITYFRSEIEDLIGFVSKYEQVPGTTISQGVEASFTHAATDWLDLGGSYTYTDSKTEAGERNVRVPRHAFVLSASARPAEKWTVSADLKYVSDTLDTIFGPPPTFSPVSIALEDYVLLNAKVSYQMTDSTQIYLRGENLLNESYQTVKGFATPGIAVFAGIKTKF